MPPSFALVQRELLRTLRKGRAFFFLVCIVLVTMWVLMEGWPGEYTPASMLGWRSQNVLGSLVIAIYIAGLVLMPAYGATSLVVEREQHTWDLLALTLIRPAGVVFGKLLNTLGIYTLLTIAVLPVVAAVYFLVGVDWLLILTLCPIVAVTAFWAASIGVMCSAWLRSTVPSVLASYVCVAFVLGAYLIPVAIVDEFFRVPQLYGFFDSWGPVLSSPMALVFAIEDDYSLLHYAAAMVMQLGYGFLALFMAWLAIWRSREYGVPGDQQDRSVRGRVRRFLGSVWKPRPMRRPISGRVNPMFAKERYWGWQGRRGLWLVACLGVLVLEAAILIPLRMIIVDQNVLGGDGILCAYWGMVGAAIVALVAPALLANTLSKEYERDNMDALRMTLLRPSHIIMGKVLSGAWAAVPFFLGMIASGMLVAAMVEDEVWPWRFVVVVLVSLGVSIVLSLSLSMFASILARRTPSAIVLSYVCAWTVLFGVFWMALMAEGEWRSEFGRAYFATVAFLSPMTGCIYHLARFDFPEGPSPLVHPLIYSRYWVSNVVFHLAFTIALLLICIRDFRVNRMRDP